MINDKNIYLLNDNERTKFRALNIGFVFQMFYLIPYLNVLENTMLSGGLKDDGTKHGKALKLADYHQNGGTVIMATHGDGADKIADRIILLKKGEFEHIISYK